MKKLLHLFPLNAFASSLALAFLFTASRLAAQAGEALNFDGTDDLVSLSNSGNLPTSTTPFTIETWIYVEATSEQFPTVFSQNGDNLVMWLHSGSGYSLAARVGGNQVDGTSVSLNTWTHVALTFDGSTSRLYQNGSLTGTAAGGNPNTSATFYMGYWTGNGRYFKGSLDEFRIWSGARTGAEISANMGSEIATMPNSLVGYYKFNEGTANGNNAGVTTLPDIANSTSETGTLSSFALTGSSSNWTTGSGITQTCSYYDSNIPEINLVGNGNSIPDGTSSTSSSNFTDFGNAITNLGKSRAFTIQNNGSGSLTVSAISFGGTNAADFSVSGISFPTTVAASGSTTFTVNFLPTSNGGKSATINIVNDDCDEGNYDFALSGTGTNTFTFSNNSDWATAANWDVEVVPTTANLTSGRSVVIAQNCTMNSIGITFSSGTSLTVNSTKSLSLNTTSGITVNSGATLTVQSSGSISQGFIDNYGTMNISGSYTAFYMTNRASATLNILSGGSYSCPACAESFLVDGTINNSGTMHAGTGSTWQGTINNNAGGTITDGGNGAQIQLGANGTLNNYGTFVSRTAGMSGIFNNYSTGTLTMPATCHFTVKNGSTFTNDGSVTLPSSNTLFDIQAGGTMVNQNTVSGIGGIAQSGTFTNSAAADINPGSSPGKLTVTGSLDLGSGTYNCEVAGTVQGTGYDWLAISGAATLTNATLNVTWGFTPSAGQSFSVITFGSRTGEFATVNIPPVSGLVFTVTHSVAAVTISANSEPVTYTFTGSGNWGSAGNWDANGVPPNPLLTGDNIVINGSGTCTMDASKTINAGASLTVNASKTLEISGSFTMTNNGVMTVNGTFSKTSGNSVLTNSATGSITVSSGGALNNLHGSFTNAGTLDNQAGGTLFLDQGSFSNSGNFSNVGTHTNSIASWANSGTFTNAGSFTCSQGTSHTNNGSFTNNSGSTISLQSLTNAATFTITNNGTLNAGFTNNGTFINNSSFGGGFAKSNASGATWTNSSGATMSMTQGSPFTNAGMLNNEGSFTLTALSGAAIFTNTATGVVNSTGAMTLSPDQGSTNSGTFNVNGSTMTINGTFTNNGTLNNSAAVVLNSTFKGTGTLVQSGTFTNNSTGIIAPGTSPGTLNVTGNFDLASSTYQCEIAGTTQGTTYDLLAISGTATIGIMSKLHVIFSVPVVNGTSFDVLTAGTVSGTFGTVTFANTGTGNVTAVSVTYPGGNKVRVTATSLLPVELVRFTGKETDGKTLLEWETASELNNEGFHIERSMDGLRWSDLGFVAGNGSTTEAHRYEFLDNKPLPSLNYYRLRQVDFDGGEEFSKVVSVDFRNRNGGDLSVFPNPVYHGEFTLLLPDNFEEKVKVQLFSPTGQILLTATCVSGANPLNVNSLPTGIYTLRAGSWVEKILVTNQ